MDHFGAFLLVLAANLDNFGVGMALGTGRIQVPHASNLLVALVTSGGTALGLLVGRWFSGFLLPVAARGIGAAVIATVGLWVFYQELVRVHRQDGEKVRGATRTTGQLLGLGTRKLKELLKAPSLADTDYSGHIDAKEACLLGGALALNNFVAGAGAGVFGLDIALAFGAVLVFSLVFLWLGIKLGRTCQSRWLGEKSGLVGGLLLVAIGVLAFFF